MSLNNTEDVEKKSNKSSYIDEDVKPTPQEDN